MSWAGRFFPSLSERFRPCRPARRGTAKRPRDSVRLCLEALEDRLVPSFNNVLVNNPASDTGTNDTQSETTLVLAGSTVVVGFNDSESNNGNNKFTGFARSTDGGATFTDGGTLPTSTAGDAGDPSMARDNVTGTIYFATLGYSNSNVIQVFRSSDNGATWSAPVNAAPGFGSGVTLDKEWITVDNAPGAGQGTVYAVFTDFPNIFSDNGIYLTRSTDGGNTWSTPLSLGGSQGGYVTVGPDHSVYVFDFSSGSPNQIQMRKSTNQGATFGAPVTVATLTTTGSNGDLGLTVSNSNGTAIRSNAFPQAVVTSNGIDVVFNDKGTATGDKADVFFARSTDGGTTWTRTKLNDDATTTDQWQPALAVTPDGSHVGVFWYDRRLDPNDGNIDRYGVIGTVSGSTVTFGPNFRITDTSFPAVVGQDPLINSTYMGDYDVAAADNSAFYLTWGDNRLSDAAHANQPDVRFARVPLAGTTHFSVTTSPTSTTAGNAFNVTVTALDANNNPDPTYTGIVHFTSTDHNAAVVLPADYMFNAGDAGTHTFINGATLVTSGNQTVTATDTVNGSVNGSASESVAATTATHLAVTAPANVTAGAPFTITVTAQDQYNNTATTYGGTVDFSSSDGSSPTLPGPYAFGPGDAGTHTFTNGVTLNSTGSQTITATDSVTPSITGTATTNVSQLIQATRFSVTTSVTTTTAGTAFSVTVTAQDNNGNTANGYRGTVHFSSTDTRSGVVLPPDYQFTATDNGVHTFTNGVTLVTAGNQTVTATDTVSASVTGSAAVTVNPAAATHLGLAAPSSTRVNVAFTVTVTALDAFGNTATGYRGTVHFTSSLRRTRLPANYQFTAADAGVHVFTNGVTFTRTGTATLTVTDTRNSSISGSARVNVTNSPLAGPGSPIDADGGDLGDLIGEILAGLPGGGDRDHGLQIGIVLQELQDMGILAAFFAENHDRNHHDVVALLRQEIETYLDGDVSIGDFRWL
jgi:hypothetical protein